MGAVKRPREDAPVADWYRLEAAEVLRLLQTDPATGLSSAEAAARQAADGPNDLVETAGRSLGTILWEQLRSPLVALLVIAAAVSWFLDEPRDATAILIIVVLNTVLGFSQEYRAEGAMAALRRLEVSLAKVRRDGRLVPTPARELVRGDLIVLEAGDRVPADTRLVEAVDLQVLESALTGESEAVPKDPQALPASDPPLGDRACMAFVGTTVTHGHGLAVVTATGMATELGKIAGMLQAVEREPTPLQRRLGRLSRSLAGAALALVTLVVVLGWLRGEALNLLFMTALSLAVAAVPEGLPAVATVVLAIGSRRMLARQALIRRLPAVETLGSVTVICSDKTGTLTRNQMTMAALETASEHLDLHGDSDLRPLAAEPSLQLLLDIAVLCNDALVDETDRVDDAPLASFFGDPTEVALVAGAARFGITKAALEERMPRVAEAPFDAERKRMTTVHHIPTGTPDDLWQRLAAGHSGADTSHVALCKGGVDALLSLTDRIWVGDQVLALDDARRERLQTTHDRLAKDGMRVLGFALRPVPEPAGSAAVAELEQELIFVGMAGLRDPLRHGVKAAVERCRNAGIRPIMITGDHPVTARAVANQLGIAESSRLVAGSELEQMADPELDAAVDEVAIYARVAPEHKLRIVRALQAHGHVVAMTGDGVNDAPALRQANIGLAMGVAGTDVAKEAAEMVLLDDHFTTIVAAVEEGRTAYDNIRKFIKYTLASNTAEIGVMILGPFLGMPLPLLPLQILWINLVTDGLPGLALSLEPAERDTMRRPPFPPSEGVFHRGLGRDIVWIGLLGALVTLAAGGFYWHGLAASPENWQTVIFTVLTLSQMGNALAIRSNRESLFGRDGLENRALLAAVGLTFGLQMAALYVPFLQETLGTRPLAVRDLLFCLALSTITLMAIEGQKLWRRKRRTTRESRVASTGGPSQSA